MIGYSRSGDNQAICYITEVIDLLLVSKTSSDFICLSLFWVGRENEFAFLILLFLSSLSYVITFDVREWLALCFQQWAILSV